jgi:formate-dependent phosphoribosylglycinamide formyltransferase (GAR transformylase)
MVYHGGSCSWVSSPDQEIEGWSSPSGKGQRRAGVAVAIAVDVEQMTAWASSEGEALKKHQDGTGEAEVSQGWTV